MFAGFTHVRSYPIAIRAGEDLDLSFRSNLRRCSDGCEGNAIQPHLLVVSGELVPFILYFCIFIFFSFARVSVYYVVVVFESYYCRVV
jgi:hypothetical protein